MMELPSKQSLELAAQCWCDEETKSKEMDSALAVAFAKRLDDKNRQIVAGLEREEGMLVAIDNLQQQLKSALFK